MWLTKLIEKFFLIPETNQENVQKTFKDLDILDSVWVKEDNIIYDGWVFDVTRRCIIVVYGCDQRDFRFRIDKYLNATELEQDDKVLYSNNPK